MSSRKHRPGKHGTPITDLFKNERQVAQENLQKVAFARWLQREEQRRPGCLHFIPARYAQAALLMKALGCVGLESDSYGYNCRVLPFFEKWLKSYLS